MKATYPLLVFGLFASLIFSAHISVANMSDFLLPSEGPNASIRVESFMINKTNHSLVYVNDDLAFLLSDNEIIDSKAQMRDILWGYYLEKYYPKDLSTTVEEMRADLIAFNASRFDGFAKEEAGCRMAMGENLGEPTNPQQYSSIYEFYARYICSEYGDDIGCTDYVDIMLDIEAFFTSSYQIDADQAKILQDLVITKPEQVSGQFAEIAELTEEIEDEAEDISKTKFRLPMNDLGVTNISECKDCYGVCAEVQVNKTLLHRIEAKAILISDQTLVIGTFEDVLDRLYNSTLSRLTADTNSDQRNEYTAQMASVLQGWDTLEERATTVLLRASDAKLSQRMQLVSDLKARIDSNIASNNFTEVETDLNGLTNTVVLISDSTRTYENQLAELDAERKKTEALYLSAFTDIDDELVRTSVSEARNELQSRVTGKMNGSAVVLYTEDYKALSMEIVDAVNVKENSLIQTLFAGMNLYYQSIYNLISPLLPASFSARADFIKSSTIPLALTIGISCASFLLWIAIPALYARKSKGNSTAKGKKLFFFFIAGVGALILFVAGTTVSYFAFEAGTTKASLLDFKGILGASESPTLMLLTDDPDAKACAALIASEFSNFTLIERYDTVCKVNGNSTVPADCDAVTFPVIAFSKTSDLSISGSALGDGILYVNLDAEAYKECYVAEALK